MLCPETENGLCVNLVLIVFLGISIHKVKQLMPPVISLDVSVLNCTFTEAMVEFENETLMEMTHFRQKDNHKVDQFRL